MDFVSELGAFICSPTGYRAGRVPPSEPIGKLSKADREDVVDPSAHAADGSESREDQCRAARLTDTECTADAAAVARPRAA